MFGPYITPDDVVKWRYRWILLKNKGYVTGFYHENSNRHPIPRLGIVFDGTPLSERLMPQSPRIAPPPNRHHFFSVAELKDVERVDVCRLRDRCTGLLIHYMNDHSTVIGQWHTSYSVEHLRIYDSDSSGSGHYTVRFRIETREDYQFVADVSFSKRVEDATVDDIVFRGGEEQ